MPDQVYQGLHHNFTTPVKLWKRQNITKMKRKKAGKKDNMQSPERDKGRGESLSHHQPSQVEKVHMKQIRIY